MPDPVVTHVPVVSPVLVDKASFQQFVGAQATVVAIGFFQLTNWWRVVAIVAAAVSSLGLLLFWAVPASSPVISTLVFNLLVLGALLIFH